MALHVRNVRASSAWYPARRSTTPWKVIRTSLYHMDESGSAVAGQRQRRGSIRLAAWNRGRREKNEGEGEGEGEGRERGDKGRQINHMMITLIKERGNDAHHQRLQRERPVVFEADEGSRSCSFLERSENTRLKRPNPGVRASVGVNINMRNGGEGVRVVDGNSEREEQRRNSYPEAPTNTGQDGHKMNEPIARARAHAPPPQRNRNWDQRIQRRNAHLDHLLHRALRGPFALPPFLAFAVCPLEVLLLAAGLDFEADEEGQRRIGRRTKASVHEHDRVCLEDLVLQPRRNPPHHFHSNWHCRYSSSPPPPPFWRLSLNASSRAASSRAMVYQSGEELRGRWPGHGNTFRGEIGEEKAVMPLKENYAAHGRILPLLVYHRENLFFQQIEFSTPVLLSTSLRLAQPPILFRSQSYFPLLLVPGRTQDSIDSLAVGPRLQRLFVYRGSCKSPVRLGVEP
ncbi:hypothetical protein K438DRAFT_2126212 [Mycena galopus ATCC 62051]|nr:hypothetical protein K438DRAFT_2126212 [Mycena galopus ATCC 62051]